MSGGRRRFVVACCACAALHAVAAGGVPPREAHGSADAYAAPGVALAWAVLRGPSEAGTRVVIRVVADPLLYTALAVIGRDPFTGRAQPLLARTPVAGTIDLTVPRAHFADFPRTELTFDGAAPAAAPALVVYFAGVPDTTPEFATADRLDAYLAARIVRARADAGSKLQ